MLLFTGENRNLMGEEKYLLSSVTNALKVMDLLAEKSPLGLAEISKELGFGKSSTFRLLYTLEEAGYVVKTEEIKYMLSRKFAYYGDKVAARNDHFSLARPALEALRDKFGEATHMSVLLPNLHLMFVEKADANYNLQMRSVAGYDMPAYCSGSGKVLLAALLGTEKEKELKNIKFEKKTRTTIDNYDGLVAELQKIRNQGYGIDNEESELGLTCIAVPVLGADGDYQYAISISGATQRVRENQIEYLQALRETAEKISEIMGL